MRAFLSVNLIYNMPDRIKHLPQDLVNQIAAGEVVERPASVLKELIENSIDAESTNVIIKIEKGGTRLISVADNGIGMSNKDALVAFERHATSKISSKEDLFNIHTLGFRGEALASVASVSKVRLKTREIDVDAGTYVEIEGGKLIKSMDIGCPAGTEIEVRDIFYNLPARKGFLKSPVTEIGHMLNIVTHYALAYKDVHLNLINVDRGNRKLLDFPPVKRLEERIFQIHGGDVVGELVDISCDIEGYYIYGLISKPSLTFNSKENQLFFVNKRSIRNPTLIHAIQEAYLDLIPKDRYPLVVLFVDLDPGLVDVNVHPSKREVRFKDSKYIHDIVAGAIRESLQKKGRPYVTNYNSYNKEDIEPVKYKVREVTYNPFIEEVDFHPQEIVTGPSIRILGQVGALFIVAEIDGELNIVDQHAAHERVIYDRLKRGYDTGKIDVQCLLIPDIIELSLDKTEVLMQYIDPLNRLGFDVDLIGERSFITRSIPAIFAGEDSKRILSDMVDEIVEMELPPGKDLKLIAKDNIVKALLSKKACHSAVRAKGLLSNGEMFSLLLDLLHTEMPYTCPHGRPVLKRFSADDLARMFDRK